MCLCMCEMWFHSVCVLQSSSERSFKLTRENKKALCLNWRKANLVCFIRDEIEWTRFFYIYFFVLYCCTLGFCLNIKCVTNKMYYYYYFCCLLFENRAENEISNINCCKSWIVWSTGLNFSLFLNKPLGRLLLQGKIIIQREKRIIKVSLLLWKMPKKHFCIKYIFQNIYSKAARKLKP